MKERETMQTKLFQVIVDAFIFIRQPDVDITEKENTRQFSSVYTEYGNSGLLLTLVLCPATELDLWKQLVGKVILSDVLTALMPAIEVMRATVRANGPMITKRPLVCTSYQSAVIDDCIATFDAWLPITIGATYTYMG